MIKIPLTIIKTLLAPPVFTDKDKTRKANLLNTISLIILFSVTPYAMILLFINYSPLILAVLTSAIMGIPIAIFLMRNGLVNAGSIVFILVGWISITSMTITFGGVKGPWIFGYILVVICAGLLLGKWKATFIAGLCFISGIAVLWMENRGIFPTRTASSAEYLITMFFTAVIAVALLDIAMKSTDKALRKAHHYATDLENHKARLEEIVTQRTSALQLKTEALARSNTNLEQFAYVASHDLQEPLRMVASYLKLIEKRYKDKLDKDGHEFIDFAVDGAKRMQGLIQDLLMYSRVSTKGKLFEPTECQTVYEKAIKNLEISIDEYKANVTRDDLPQVLADEGQLMQLFQNLIGNSLKFCKDRTPEVHVSAKQEGNSWIFGIKDNGIGVAPEHQERIFQIFQRLHNREEYEGTGIGLAVCKKIVERHGGKIWVESKVGKGTTFWFTIPIRTENNKQAST